MIADGRAAHRTTRRRRDALSGDCREILPTLPKVDAVVTDPPYGIEFESRHAVPSADNGIMCGNKICMITSDDVPFDAAF